MHKAFHALWSTIFLGDAKRRSLAEILRQIPVFADLSVFELKFVLPILHQREFKKGELIFGVGEAGNGMYIIATGTIEITGQSDQGEEVVYAELQERQFFGELSLVDGQPRSANALAAKPSVLYGFFKPDLLELMRKQPVLGAKILMNLSQVLGARLRDTNHKLMELQEELGQLRGNP